MWFVVGALAGGAMSGTVIGVGAMLAPPPPRWLTLTVIGAVAFAVVLRDLRIIDVPLPQNRRQVRQSVLSMEPASGALMFGFEMGTGARTYMTGAAPYIAVVAVLAAGGSDPLPGLLAGIGFGLGRGLVPLASSLHHDEDAWERWTRTYAMRAVPVTSAVTTTMLAVAAVTR